MRKIIFAAALFTLLIPSPSLLYADEALEAKIERVIEKYGTIPVIGMILRERGAEITVEINGELRNTHGTPEPDLVTPRSVLFDIEQAGLTVESFAALIQAEELKEEAERSQPARKVEVVERSAEAIEAERKRYGQQQIEDARKHAEEHDRAVERAEQERADAQVEWDDLILQQRAYEQSVIANQLAGGFTLRPDELDGLSSEEAKEVRERFYNETPAALIARSREALAHRQAEVLQRMRRRNLGR